MTSLGKHVATGAILFCFTFLIAFSVLAAGATRGMWTMSPMSLMIAVTGALLVWAVFPRRWLSHPVTRRVGAVALVIVVALFAVRASKVLRVRSAVNNVLSHGGRVAFDYRWESADFVRTRGGWIVPTWLRDTVGDLWLADVQHVEVHLEDAPTDTIRDFDLTPFTVVSFTSTAISDDELDSMRFNPNIQRLFLSRTKISDAGIARIATFRELKELWITDTAVSDGSLDNLARLQQLELLIVVNSKITPAGVAKLRAALPKCRVIDR